MISKKFCLGFVRVIALVFYVENILTLLAMFVVLDFSSWQDGLLLFETVTQIMLSLTVIYLIGRELKL